MKYRTKVLLTTTLSFVALMMAFTSYSVISTNLMDDLGLSHFQSGVLMSSFAAAYALMQIPSGISSDKYGSGKVLRIALLILSLSAIAFFFVNSFEIALLIRVLMGASAGLILPASTRMISAWYESRELEKALSILGLGQGIGFIISYMVIPTIVVAFNYRYGTIFVAIFSLVTTFSAIVGLTGRPDTKRVIDPEKQVTSKYDFRRILNTKIILLILINFSGAAVLFGVLSWAPLYLSSILMGPLVYVGFITAVVGVTNLTGSYTGMLSARRWGVKKTIVTSMTLSVILPLTIACSGYTIIPIIMVGLVGWATMFYFAPLWAMIPSSVDKDYAGGAFGVFNTLSFLGAFFTPLLVGYILDATTSYLAGFAAISFMAVPGLLASLFLKARAK